MWKISYVLSTPQLVKLMRYDSFCFVNKKHQVSSAITYKKRCAKTYTETKFPGSSLETRLSVDVRSTISRKTWMDDRETNMLSVDCMDQQPAYEASMLLISCGCKTNCATKRCSCMSQGLSCTYMAADALIFAKTRIEESLYQKAIDKVTTRKRIKT